MKKFLSMILAVLLLCGGILAGSLAEGEEMYEYTAKGKTAIITAVKDSNLVNAVIPAEIDGKKVVGIANDAFHN